MKKEFMYISSTCKNTKHHRKLYSDIFLNMPHPKNVFNLKHEIDDLHSGRSLLLRSMHCVEIRENLIENIIVRIKLINDYHNNFPPKELMNEVGSNTDTSLVCRNSSLVENLNSSICRQHSKMERTIELSLFNVSYTKQNDASLIPA
jgi:hypothetical protein